jgi:uncharacterized protein YkwD
MRKLARLSAGVTIAAALAGLVPAGPALAGSGRYRERHEMFLATNDSRESHGRSDVRIERAMSKIARHHSKWMARTGDLEHTKHPASAYLDGITWHCWGENIAVSGGTVADVEKAFMASDEHRANILDTCFRHVAIGTVRVDGALWVTVFFYG